MKRETKFTMERLDGTQSLIREIDDRYRAEAVELLLENARSSKNRFAAEQFQRLAQALLNGQNPPLLPRRSRMRFFIDALFVSQDGRTWLERLRRRHHFVIAFGSNGRPALFRKVGWLWSGKILLYEECVRLVRRS